MVDCNESSFENFNVQYYIFHTFNKQEYSHGHFLSYKFYVVPRGLQVLEDENIQRLGQEIIAKTEEIRFSR